MANPILDRANEAFNKISDINSKLNTWNLNDLEKVVQDTSLGLFNVLDWDELPVNEKVKTEVKAIKEKLANILGKDLDNLKEAKERQLNEEEDRFNNDWNKVWTSKVYTGIARSTLESEKTQISRILPQLDSRKTEITDLFSKIEYFKLTPEEIIENNEVKIWEAKDVALSGELFGSDFSWTKSFNLLWIDGKKAEIKPNSIILKMNNKEWNTKTYILDKVSFDTSTWKLSFQTGFTILDENNKQATDIDFGNNIEFWVRWEITDWLAKPIVNQKMLKINLSPKLADESERKTLMTGLADDMTALYDPNETEHRKKAIDKLLMKHDINWYTGFDTTKKEALQNELLKTSIFTWGWLSGTDVKKEDELKDYILSKLENTKNLQSDADFTRLFNDNKTKLTQDFLVEKIQKIIESTKLASFSAESIKLSNALSKNKLTQSTEIDKTSDVVIQWNSKDITFKDELLSEDLDWDAIDIKLKWIDGRDIIPAWTDYKLKINISWQPKDVMIKWLNLAGLADEGQNFKLTMTDSLKILDTSWNILEGISFDDFIEFKLFAQVENKHTKEKKEITKTIKFKINPKLKDKTARESLFVSGDYTASIGSAYDTHSEKIREEAVKKWFEDKRLSSFESLDQKDKDLAIKNLAKKFDTFGQADDANVDNLAKSTDKLKEYLIDKKTDQAYWQADADFTAYLKSTISDDIKACINKNLIGAVQTSKINEYLTNLDVNRFTNDAEIDETWTTVQTSVWNALDIRSNILNLPVGTNLGANEKLTMSLPNSTEISPTKHKLKIKDSKWEREVIFDDFKIEYTDNGADIKLVYGPNFRILDDSGKPIWDIDFANPIEIQIEWKVLNTDTNKENITTKTVKLKIEPEMYSNTSRDAAILAEVAPLQTSLNNANSTYRAELERKAMEKRLTDNNVWQYNSLSDEEKKVALDWLVKTLLNPTVITDATLVNMVLFRQYMREEKKDKAYRQREIDYKNYIKANVNEDSKNFIEQKLYKSISQNNVTDFLNQFDINKFANYTNTIDKTSTPVTTGVGRNLNIKSDVLNIPAPATRLATNEKLTMSLWDSTEISPTKHKLKIKDSTWEKEVIFDDFKIDYTDTGSRIKLHYGPNFRILDDSGKPIWDIDFSNPIEFNIQWTILNSDTGKETKVNKKIITKIKLQMDDTQKNVALNSLNATWEIDRKLAHEYNTQIKKHKEKSLWDKIEEWWIEDLKNLTDEQKKFYVKYLESKWLLNFTAATMTDFNDFKTFAKKKWDKSYEYSMDDYYSYIMWNINTLVSDSFEDTIKNTLDWNKRTILLETPEFLNNLQEYKTDNATQRTRAMRNFQSHIGRIKGKMKKNNYCKFFTNQSYTIPEQSVIIDHDKNEEVKYSMDLKVNNPRSFELKMKIWDKEKTLVWNSHIALVQDLLRNPDIPHDKVRLHAAYNVYKAMIWIAQKANLKLTTKNWTHRKSMHLEWDKIVLEDNNVNAATRSVTQTFDVNEKEFTQTDNLEAYTNWLWIISDSFHDLMQWEYKNYRRATKWKFMLMRKKTKTKLPNAWMLSPMKKLFNLKKNLDFNFDTSVQIWDKNISIKYEWTKFTVSDWENEYTKRNLWAILRKKCFDWLERDILGETYKNLTEKMMTNNTMSSRTYYVYDKYSKRTYIYNNGQVWYVNEENKKIWKDGYFRKWRGALSRQISTMTLLEWDRAMELYKDPYLMWKLIKTMSKSLRRWPAVDIIPDWMKRNNNLFDVA